MGARVRVNPRPKVEQRVAMEIAMLGHCGGRARVERLLENRDAIESMRFAGYGEQVDSLINTKPDAPYELYQLPIPVYSVAEFNEIFPDAGQVDMRYSSVLAGKSAWLPQAVEDFFANGGQKAWVVRIDELDFQQGFLPNAETLLHDVNSLKGIATILPLLEVGVLALPDLERLQIPANLPDIPRVRIENPVVKFLPCSNVLDDDHRERRYSSEVIEAIEKEPLSTQFILQIIQQSLQKYRPDIQCLYSLPLNYSTELGSPVLDPIALKNLEAIKKSNAGSALRHVQLLFPYLRGFDYALRSSVGLVAGLQAHLAQKNIVWRSISDKPMLTNGKPYPAMRKSDVIKWRDEPGIGFIEYRNGRVVLNDERLAVPALHKNDYANAISLKRFDGFRSGEVARFLGFLIRQLRKLGDTLAFNIDSRDPRARIMLDKFFRQLHAQGALRGIQPQDAFEIRQQTPIDNVMLFEIEISPAFPIDKLHLTFVNRSGVWQSEVVNG